MADTGWRIFKEWMEDTAQIIKQQTVYWGGYSDRRRDWFSEVK
jgi:hypothetical protein